MGGGTQSVKYRDLVFARKCLAQRKVYSDAQRIRRKRERRHKIVRELVLA